MNLFKPVFCIFNRRRRKQSGEFDIMVIFVNVQFDLLNLTLKRCLNFTGKCGSGSWL